MAKCLGYDTYIIEGMVFRKLKADMCRNRDATWPPLDQVSSGFVDKKPISYDERIDRMLNGTEKVKKGGESGGKLRSVLKRAFKAASCFGS